MKTAFLLHLLALCALLAAHVGASEDFRMPGVRRALQTMDGITVSTTIVIMVDKAEGLA